MSAKLLCYELNEVPWRVVDRHVERHPDGVLARLCAESDQYTTFTVDGGELHPWTTWPTLHRGVANDVHGIRFLNQELGPADRWPPIWELLNDGGVSTGICGSLQSYPPSRRPEMLFHVPDTFSAGPETVPPRYEPFQALNLRQTGSNKAVVSKVRGGDALGALGLLRCGVSARTLAQVAIHLARERREPLYRTRRPLLQPELAFDVLLHCLGRATPRFVTFFTNHVAGIMHRYWKYSFPEDFDYEPHGSKAERFHAESLDVALRQAERHLGLLLRFCEREGYELVVCSSMGQEAIDRGEYIPEIRIADFERLLAALGTERSVRMKLAMHPDVAFDFDDGASLEAFRTALVSLRDSAGKPLFGVRYEPVGTTLSVQHTQSEAAARDAVVMVDGARRTLEEIGLERFERDVGTGYHQPEGIMLWRRAGRAEPDRRRVRVDSRRVAPTLLRFFGLPSRDYMLPPIDPAEGEGRRADTRAASPPVATAARS